MIRSVDDELESKYPGTLKDAALLAAVKSKAAQSGGKVLVTYTRCRHVTKPPLAKAGLVFLTGSVGTISVNIKAERDRLERLDKTKGINDS